MKEIIPIDYLNAIRWTAVQKLNNLLISVRCLILKKKKCFRFNLFLLLFRSFCSVLSVFMFNQPAISVGSVTSLEPSQTVLNCSGTGNSLCKNKARRSPTFSTTNKNQPGVSISFCPRHSHSRRLLLVSGCSSRSSWR